MSSDSRDRPNDGPRWRCPIRRFVARLGDAWSVRAWRRWFIAMHFPGVGTTMGVIANGWVLATDGGGIAFVGLYVGMQALPKLLLMPLGGVVGDRVVLPPFLRKMSLLQATPLLTLAVLSLVGLGGSPAVIIGLTTAGAVIGAFAQVPKKTMSDLLLHHDDPERKNALHAAKVAFNSLDDAVLKIVAPMLVALFMAVLGSGNVGIAACLAVSPLALIWQAVAAHRTDDRALPVRERPARTRVRASVRERVIQGFKQTGSELRSGMQAVGGLPIVAYGIIALAFISTFAYNIRTIVPALAYVTWNGSPRELAWLLGAFGFGTVAGVVVSYPGMRGLLRWLLVAGLGVAATHLVLLVPVFPLQVGAMACMGALTKVFTKSVDHAMSTGISTSHASRARSLHELANHGVTTIGAPVGGVVMAGLGVSAGLWLGVVGGLGAAVIVAVGLRRTAR